MKKIAVITMSAMFALGATHVASAANTFDPETGIKTNFSAVHTDKIKTHVIPNTPDAAGGLGNAFGHLPKDQRNGNAFGLQGRDTLGNSFGHLPKAERPVTP